MVNEMRIRVAGSYGWLNWYGCGDCPMDELGVLGRRWTRLLMEWLVMRADLAMATSIIRRALVS